MHSGNNAKYVTIKCWKYLYPYLWIPGMFSTYPYRNRKNSLLKKCVRNHYCIYIDNKHTFAHAYGKLFYPHNLYKRTFFASFSFVYERNVPLTNEAF